MNINEQPRSYSQFLEFCCMLLGAVAGLLIALPFVLSGAVAQHGIPNIAAILAASLFGLLVGYRRRKSRAFFYFAMVSVLVLSALLSSSASSGN